MKSELPWHSRFDLLGVTFILFFQCIRLTPHRRIRSFFGLLGHLGRFASRFSRQTGQFLTGPLKVFLKRSNCSCLHSSRNHYFYRFIDWCARTIAPLWLVAHPNGPECHSNDSEFTLGITGCGNAGSNQLAGVIALTFYSIDTCHP